MKKILLMSFFLVLTLLNRAMAQDRTVSGTVIDKETNTGLPGVTVLVKGTPTIATSTDMNGAYSLNVPATATDLEFRFIGYRTLERPITGGPISVTMETDTRELGEVVVTALGIEREKKQLGYATQELKNETLTQGRDRSVLNAMQGKVAGVQINNLGGVGSSTRVVIRGVRSLTGSNQPLYVIDGVPIGNDAIGTGDNLNNGVDAGNRANDINPDDVESMNILKGPAAVALYGSRAANGAIIITTKSGRSAARAGKKAEITYTTSYSAETPLRLPKFQNEFGQGTAIDQPDYRENWSWGPRFDGVVRPWGQVINNQQRVKPYVGLEDNVKEFFETGHTYINSLQVGGGDEKSNYILSVSNTQQKGILPTDNNKYKRTTVKIGGETKLTNKFNSSASITYTKSGGDLVVTGQGASVYDQIIQTPRDISLLELKDLSNPFNTISGYYGAYTQNPYQILQDNSYKNNVDRVFGNVQLGYAFNDKLKATYRLGTDVSNDMRNQYQAKRVSSNPRNEGQDALGFYSEAQYYYRELNSDLMLNYFTDITEDLNVNILLGHNINQRSVNNSYFTGQNVNNNSYQGFSNVKGEIKQDPNSVGVNPFSGGVGNGKRRLYGVYGTVDFAFRDYLFLGVTARNDWSSTLPEENRSFFYPAVNLGFVFTDAFGLQDNPVISYGKLRANYAQVGNDATPYLTQPVFTQGLVENGTSQGQITAPFNGVPAFEVGNRIASPSLQPEITKSWEVGTELRFVNDRISLDMSYYDSKSTDQIISVPISTASGFRAQTINAGLVRNKGFEALLTVVPVKTDNFSWEISGNYSRNRNTVVELFPGTQEIAIGGLTAATASLVATEGQPYGNFKSIGYRYDPQGRIIVGADGIPLPALTPEVFGNIQPDFMAGVTNTVKFKGLTLNVTFDTKQGGEMYSRTRDIQRFVGTDPTTLYNDRQPFVVPNTVVENLDGTFSENTTPVKVFDYWGKLPSATSIIDASYTKLREVSLSYTLPASLIAKTPFGGITVGINGRNLALWTPDENTYVDPEASNFGNGNAQGFDFSGSPSLRSFGGNLRVTF
jgi:TonB-linked SusC/RagA family outer membrane protein